MTAGRRPRFLRGVSSGSKTGSVRARSRAPDREAVEQAVSNLLAALGFDPADPALETTPARRAEALIDVLTGGYETTPEDALGRGFPAGGDGPVVATNIPLLFVCPHHLTVARGEAHVAFAPTERVPGLARIARLVDVLGRRLVLQEDLTDDIAEALHAALDAKAAVAIVEATHGCVAIENLACRDTLFTTRASRGPDALVASMVQLIGDTLRASWSTSASEPATDPPESKSPSR